MGLVSSLYRLTASEGAITEHDAAKRLDRRIARLVSRLGRDAVMAQILAFKVPRDLEAMRERLWLEAWVAEETR